MPKTRRLLRGEITYSAAKDKEVNILHRLEYYNQEIQFFSLLDKSRDWIRAVVSYHLNLRSSDHCRVADVSDWLHGSFNETVFLSDSLYHIESVKATALGMEMRNSDVRLLPILGYKITVPTCPFHNYMASGYLLVRFLHKSQISLFGCAAYTF
ncbi:hypothetical protein DTO282F9_5149 [Paecilomyces variotii]|nr:hypothetical protein DTO027B9_3974 [Paecilomyces variotii]KAJ9398032.1 hypothetical protein DTO282F9_5149 [Paecilomyces variotii]